CGRRCSEHPGAGPLRGSCVWAMTDTRNENPAALFAVWPCHTSTPFVEPDCAPITASEDFARFLEHVPGCFVFLGNGTDSLPESCYFFSRSAVRSLNADWLNNRNGGSASFGNDFKTCCSRALAARAFLSLLAARSRSSWRSASASKNSPVE